MSLPEAWREFRIADVLERVADKIDPRTESKAHFYVGLEHIESHTGRLLRDFESEATEGLLSIKTAFRKGDVLFGKLRPNLNKVYIAEANGICSTDIWALRVTDFLLPEFAAIYLRSPAFNRGVSQLAAGANLPRVSSESFDRLPMFLPPLPEQQRIVEVLREAGAITTYAVRRRNLLDEACVGALNTAVASCEESEWLALSSLVETKYGTSVRADAEPEEGTPVLRIPNVLGGEVDTGDLKHVVLASAERERLIVDKDDVLIVRSNGNSNYVGRCAAVDERVARMGCVYASYLIRLRADPQRLRGTYLAALLNSPIGRKVMRNAIRTTAGQSNLSAESLGTVRLPIPSMDIQLVFERTWSHAQSVRRHMDVSDHAGRNLVAAITTEALSGRLTAAWREQYAAELQTAARERDAALGAPKPRVQVRVEEHAPPERPTGFDRPRRQALIEQLSSFQHEVWNTLRHEWRGAVLADDPKVFEDFCTNPQTIWRLEGFDAGRDEVRRALEQLAAMGLVRKMSMPRDNRVTDRVEYLTAFRPLREDEASSRVEKDTAGKDAERAGREIERRKQEGR